MNDKKKIEVIQVNSIYHPDPSVVFNTICNNYNETLLLESSEINKKQNLESMIIVSTAIRISCFKNIVKMKALTYNGSFLLNSINFNILNSIRMSRYNENYVEIIFPKINYNLDEDKKLFSESIFDALRIIINSVNNTKNIPRTLFFGGLFSYDLISSFEPIPRVHNVQYQYPDFCFYLSEILLILDHKKKTCVIQSSLFSTYIEEKKRIKRKIKKIQDQLNNQLIPIFKTSKIHSNNSTYEMPHSKRYIKKVQKMKNLIAKGEVFQVVVSKKFNLPCTNPIAAYNNLKKNNPSPYMFFMKDSEFTLFGASPESFLKYNPKNRILEIHPIAGTRPRGKDIHGNIDKDLDTKIELEMRTNEKELAEHFMLVDLARNDLAKICEPGSRYVSILTKVDRYSHVMHLVSKVKGILNPKLDMFHAYQACMNMGTLTGAPKIRAMQLISEENELRGPYGGSIGYFTGEGDLDTCIVIRSAWIQQGIATVQAGAGIVLDSDPLKEEEECKNKVQAVIKAITETY